MYPGIRITGYAEARLFPFFPRLAQAEKRKKTKGFYSSCNLYFLNVHLKCLVIIVLNEYKLIINVSPDLTLYIDCKTR